MQEIAVLGLQNLQFSRGSVPQDPPSKCGSSGMTRLGRLASPLVAWLPRLISTALPVNMKWALIKRTAEISIHRSSSEYEVGAGQKNGRN